MERSHGYYWVELAGIWGVALWTGDYWLWPGNEIEFDDNDFDTINETRIVNATK